MKNIFNNFEMTREAQKVLEDFFSQLKNQADFKAVDSSSYNELTSSLYEHLNFALRDICDQRRVVVVDAQLMLEIILSLGTPEEIIEGLGYEESVEMPEKEPVTFKPGEYNSRNYRILKRSEKDRWILGVCGGFAEYWGISSLLIRFLVLFSGIGPIAYIIVGLIMPPADYPASTPPDRSSLSKSFQAILKGIFILFMIIALYLPIGGALLTVAAAGFFKILSELGIAGWQSNDFWFYFTTGIPGYISGVASLVTGLGFFALLTQFFAASFFKKSLINTNTRKLVTVVAAMGLIVFFGFWSISSSMNENPLSEKTLHNFAAQNVRELTFAFPKNQMPYHKKSVQIIGDPESTEVSVQVTRKVGGWSEGYASDNLKSLSYKCDLSSDGKLQFAGNIEKPAWNFYPFPEISFLIRVPERQLLKISNTKEHGFDGDIEIVRVSGPIDVSLATGKITLDSVSSPEITLNTDVSNINIQQVNTDKIEATTKVGQITCSSLKGTKATFETEVGSIEISQTNCDELSASSQVGNIKIEEFNANKVKLKTQTGSIKVESSFLKENSELNIFSEVGSVRLKLPENQVPVLNLSSNIGHISNDFKELKAQEKAPRIFVKTNIGSIRIRKQRTHKKPQTIPGLPAEAPDNN